MNLCIVYSLCTRTSTQARDTCFSFIHNLLYQSTQVPPALAHCPTTCHAFHLIMILIRTHQGPLRWSTRHPACPNIRWQVAIAKFQSSSVSSVGRGCSFLPQNPSRVDQPWPKMGNYGRKCAPGDCPRSWFPRRGLGLKDLAVLGF